jgi:pilus assembly protein CpaF
MPRPFVPLPPPGFVPPAESSAAVSSKAVSSKAVSSTAESSTAVSRAMGVRNGFVPVPTVALDTAQPPVAPQHAIEGERALRVESVALPAELDPVAVYIGDPAVTDVFVNGARGLWVDRGSGAVRDPVWRADEAAVRDLARALIALGGRHIDEASPCVDVRLTSGMRIHAVLPPISTAGTTISIRIPRVVRPTLEALEARGMFRARPGALAWLRSLVTARVNVLVTGAAGSGKTTLLAALLAQAPPSDRIVTIEDVAELTIAHPHHVALEARQPNLEGAGGVGLARLVREALRMRPDRLVLGECRGDEVRELLAALNTGHDGGAGTVHASGLREVPARLEALGALAGLDDTALARQAISAIGAVVHVARSPEGVREFAAAGRLSLAGGRLAIEEQAPWTE